MRTQTTELMDMIFDKLMNNTHYKQGTDKGYQVGVFKQERL